MCHAVRTRHTGIELGLSQNLAGLHWYVTYSLIEATFEEDFAVNSPNHPVFEDDPGAAQIVGKGKLLVNGGASIPGIPCHQANAGVDLAFNERFLIGADVAYRSGVYLRGDEVNLLGKTDDYAIVSLRGEVRISNWLTLFARVENVFDEEYETFGLLGEPDEVFVDFEDPRFLGAGRPFGAWVGFRIQL